jgi:hypothetical protein
LTVETGGHKSEGHRAWTYQWAHAGAKNVSPSDEIRSWIGDTWTSRLRDNAHTYTGLKGRRERRDLLLFGMLIESEEREFSDNFFWAQLFDESARVPLILNGEMGKA